MEKIKIMFLKLNILNKRYHTSKNYGTQYISNWVDIFMTKINHRLFTVIEKHIYLPKR